MDVEDFMGVECVSCAGGGGALSLRVYGLGLGVQVRTIWRLVAEWSVTGEGLATRSGPGCHGRFIQGRACRGSSRPTIPNLTPQVQLTHRGSLAILPFRSLAQAINGPEASSDQEEHDPIRG